MLRNKIHQHKLSLINAKYLTNLRRNRINALEYTNTRIHEYTYHPFTQLNIIYNVLIVKQ